MHVIHSIEVAGLRNREAPLTLVLDPHVNFLIGRNGTGKTTLINLVNAALSGDISVLSSNTFDYLKIKLRRGGSNRRPALLVTKVDSTDDLPSSIRFEVWREAGKSPRKFEFVANDERNVRFRYTGRDEIYHRSWDHNPSNLRSLHDEISALVDTTWLSVHRSVTARTEANERFEFPVDKRLSQVARDFGTYFSVLDKKASDETTAFQQVYFLSLLSPPRSETIAQMVKSIDVDREYDAIQAIFSEFKLRPTSYSSKIESFRKRIKRAKETYTPNAAMAADDFLALTDLLRIHSITESWNSLLEKREEIYSPKDAIVNTINSLFLGKTLSISAGNEPHFYTDDDKPLPLMALSSGEKQMLILLGETLLQRSRASIFMADEPELSLHIDWQLSLVPSLREINSNAQILFATHSPDVVGAYGVNAFNLENL